MTDTAGSTPDTRPAMPRALLILLGLAAAVVVLMGMQSFAGLIVPVFLALNLIIAVHPVGSALTRRGAIRVSADGTRTVRRLPSGITQQLSM